MSDSTTEESATAEAAAVLAALRNIGAGIDGYRRAVAATTDMATVDLVAIGLLRRSGPLRAGRIGERTGLTPGSVTALLNRLEGRGYLSRARSDHDRRGVQVSLTPAGRKLGDALVANLLPALAAVVDDIGAAEYVAVLNVLDRIASALVAVAADPRLGEHFGNLDGER